MTKLFASCVLGIMLFGVTFAQNVIPTLCDGVNEGVIACSEGGFVECLDGYILQPIGGDIIVSEKPEYVSVVKNTTCTDGAGTASYTQTGTVNRLAYILITAFLLRGIMILTKKKES